MRVEPLGYLSRVLPEETFGPIDYRLGRQVFILESGVRFPVGLLKLKQCVKTNLQADVLIYQYESASTISTLESGMDPYKWVPSTLQVCRG